MFLCPPGRLERAFLFRQWQFQSAAGAAGGNAHEPQGEGQHHQPPEIQAQGARGGLGEVVLQVIWQYKHKAPGRKQDVSKREWEKWLGVLAGVRQQIPEFTTGEAQQENRNSSADSLLGWVLGGTVDQKIF